MAAMSLKLTASAFQPQILRSKVVQIEMDSLDKGIGRNQQQVPRGGDQGGGIVAKRDANPIRWRKNLAGEAVNAFDQPGFAPSGGPDRHDLQVPWTCRRSPEPQGVGDLLMPAASRGSFRALRNRVGIVEGSIALLPSQVSQSVLSTLSSSRSSAMNSLMSLKSRYTEAYRT